MYVGLYWVTRGDPSPKLHFHEVGVPVLLSVNDTVKGAFPVVLDAEKSAAGSTSFVETLTETLTVPNFELVPFALNTVRLTV